MASGLLEEQDGKLKVATPTVNNGNVASDKSLDSDTIVEEINPKPAINVASVEKQRIIPSTAPTVAINIQLQIPETENAEVYENLFKALRKHLLNPDE